MSSQSTNITIHGFIVFHRLPFPKGFATVSMLTFSNLESTQGSFGAMRSQKGQTFRLNSRVVTVSVSNRNTSRLDQPVKLTFDHLNQVAGQPQVQGRKASCRSNKRE